MSDGNSSTVKASRTKTHWILLALFLLSGLGFRIWSLAVDELAYDDGFTMQCATAETWSAMIKIVADDVHPPFYFFFARALFQVTPNELWILRLISVLMCVAAIYFTYEIGRSLFDDRVALVSAALFSWTPYNIYWSHMARNHQLQLMVGTLSWWLLIRWLQHRKPRDLWIYAVVMIVVIQANYMGFIILVTQGLVMLVWLLREEKSFVKVVLKSRWVLVVMVFALLTFLPWKIALSSQMSGTIMPRSQFEHPISPLTPLFMSLFGGMGFQPVYFLIPMESTTVNDVIVPPPNYLVALNFFILGLESILLCIAIWFNIRAVRQGFKRWEFYIFVFLPPAFPVIAAKVLGMSLALRHLHFTAPGAILLFAFGMVEFLKKVKPDLE